MVGDLVKISGIQFSASKYFRIIFKWRKIIFKIPTKIE